MQVLVGEFATQAQAEDALLRLHAAGFSDDQTALVDNTRLDATDTTPGAAGDGPVEPAQTVVSPAAAADVTAPAADGVQLPGDPTTPPQLPPMEHVEERAVENTALGSAVGAFAGGAVAGPLGAAVGVVAGGAIGAWVSRWHAGAREARRETYGAPYLLAVEVEGPAAEAHRLLLAAGAAQVHTEPL